MPRVSSSHDYLLGRSSCHTLNHCYRTPSLITDVNANESSSILSPNEIDEILSRKLYDQLKTTSTIERGE